MNRWWAISMVWKYVEILTLQMWNRRKKFNRFSNICFHTLWTAFTLLINLIFPIFCFHVVFHPGTSARFVRQRIPGGVSWEELRPHPEDHLAGDRGGGADWASGGAGGVLWNVNFTRDIYFVKIVKSFQKSGGKCWFDVVRRGVALCWTSLFVSLSAALGWLNFDW